ncbi:MAG TPA: hypothetical protein VH350_20035, partial [Candidatus Sulfotelmatobacter sp.]|nr:hypothetical protein [Candidatus Sulfotelmatobacter sp.]
RDASVDQGRVEQSNSHRAVSRTIHHPIMPRPESEGFGSNRAIIGFALGVKDRLGISPRNTDMISY